MAALVQSFPQPSNIPMLQTRPTSASATLQASSSGQSHQSRSVSMPRNMYSPSGSLPATGYRGQSSNSPVAPYAFTSTPGLANAGNTGRQSQVTPHLRSEDRTCSAPASPYSQTHASENSLVSARPRFPSTQSGSRTSSSSSSSIHGQHHMSKDDSSILTDSRSMSRGSRPLSTVNTSIPVLPATMSNSNSPAKPSPDRYRRNRNNSANINVQAVSPSGSALPSGSGMASVGHLYNHPTQSSSSPSLHTFRNFGTSGTAPQLGQLPPTGRPLSMADYPGQVRTMSVDDMQLDKELNREQALRYRRRSVHTLNAAELESLRREEHGKAMSHIGHKAAPSRQTPPTMAHQPAAAGLRPASHGRNSSAESVTSSRSSNSRPSSVGSISPFYVPAKRDSPTSGLATNASSISMSSLQKPEAKLVNIPPRGSSDVNKRLNNPSPLSRPITLSPDSPSSSKPFDSISPAAATKSAAPTTQNIAPSASSMDKTAAQQLAALNDRDPKKGMKHRLRRAFSFGSAAELRRASAENSLNKELANERAKLRKDRFREDQEAEQAAIARKQEAGGIGEGIYSGQGNFFTGSTDNISISSTASSASVMIRKMGQGMKKSTRSLVGLFRPKSVIGVSLVDSAVPEPSMAQVSMVTVEAEREKVNVNANPHDQVRGGTGFPKLERNSIDAANTAVLKDQGLPTGTSDGGDSTRSRKSIVGGEKERAEVLAAVKKGILKRTGTDSGNSSPVARPVDTKAIDFNLPNIPHVNDTPGSSLGSTPPEERLANFGHKRSDSVTIEGEEYFMSGPKFSNVGDSKSAPGTPNGTVRHNVNFSPRIQFHDTWPSGEYDRRGEVATCNRLTPMLAQQIKEELNTFKMEMEVHEQSKVYTHFF